MISDARGGHVSPGVYTEERDIAYSVKSLGVTSLGIAGEALKGPAFQPIAIKDWGEYVDYFGGTSPEKFIGTNIPKYEMSYIAKEYLKESRNLYACRILGLSGYDAKKAWVITANIEGESGETYPVAVIRSKQYETNGSGEICESLPYNKWDEYVSAITSGEYETKVYNTNCMAFSAETESEYSGIATIDGSGNLVGKIGLNVTLKPESSATTESGETVVYNISLDYRDNDYIYNVIGIDPIKGNDKIFIEEVYDKSLKNLLEKNGIKEGNETGVSSVTLNVAEIAPDESDDDSGNTAYTSISNYKSEFRPAITPWFVSEVKGASTEAINIVKLFRFITISDGNAANFQVKVSIERIRPEEGLFDVLIRDYYDSDASPIVLERYSNCTMSEGDKSYVGLKIGTADGMYAARSKYVVIEIAEGDDIRNSVPCGYVGYPITPYKGGEAFLEVIDMNYNKDLIPTVKAKRQYFGLNASSIDEDVLTFKGNDAYGVNADDITGVLPATEYITKGFHLDSIFSDKIESGETPTVYLNGLPGYKFECVNPTQNSTIYKKIPRINTEDYMKGTIYADINVRKFTAYFYGGFDGWHIFEKTRSNTDPFRADKYFTSSANTDAAYEAIGSGDEIKELNQMLDINLPSTAITSDYYAYLAAYRQFANPNDFEINLFATPGIDWHNNTLLVDDVISLIEDVDDGRGGDALYIVTSPMDEFDKPNEVGGEENPYVHTMTRISTPIEVSNLLDDTDIDSSYAATFYPWAKYYDADAHVYLDMPVTRDVVRDMAYTDNKLYPWFSPAGVSRGNVDCVKSTLRLTLSDEDDLYNGRINPIKSFAKDGVKLWGNKTMYTGDTPLNRINVRRLMLRVKELVVRASKNLIFEQYDSTLEKQFRGLVEPILNDVKENRGISDFRVVTENTPETRDQHILPCRISVKPISALEYISISFVVYPESVEFED